MKHTPFISVVLPCFNEQENIPLIVQQINEVLKCYSHEILIIDDGSTDGTAIAGRQLSEKEAGVCYFRFSRNFGHQAAVKAGIDHATGDVVITIDADLQQPPALIPAMISKWEEGFEIVEAVREDNKNAGFGKRQSSKLFYRILAWLSDYPVVQGVSDFRLIDRKVAEIVKNTTEQHLYLRGLFSWMGFKHAYVAYSLNRRANGTSGYSVSKMLRLATAGVTSMSIKPLRLALVAGLLISGVSFLYIVYALFIAVFTQAAIPGWTSTIISVLFLAGIQLLVLGIMGEYLGKLFIENKRRPNYIISEKKQKDIEVRINNGPEIQRS